MSISSATTFLSLSFHSFCLMLDSFLKKYFSSSSRLCSQFSYLGMYIINLTRVCFCSDSDPGYIVPWGRKKGEKPLATETKLEIIRRQLC